MKTINDFTEKEINALVDDCQPEYCSWVTEWMEKNNVIVINKTNVLNYIYDEFSNPENYIEDILENQAEQNRMLIFVRQTT